MKFNPIQIIWERHHREIAILNFQLSKKRGSRHLLCLRWEHCIVDLIEDKSKWILTVHWLFNFNYRF